MALVKDSPVGPLGGLNQTATYTTEDAQLFSIHVVGTASMTLSFQYSNDGTNWVTGMLTNLNNLSSLSTATLSGATNLLFGSTSLRAITKYFRVLVSAYTSGSVNVYFVSSRYGA